MDALEMAIITACKKHWKQLQKTHEDDGEITRTGQPNLYVEYIESQPYLVIEQNYKVSNNE